MIRLDIELNGESYCRAGLDGCGIISFMLHWMDFDGQAVTDDREAFRKALSMSVSGHRAERPFTDEEAMSGAAPPPMTAIHWREINQGLVVGDEIRIRIVEAEDADPYTETPLLPSEDEDALDA